MSKFTRPELILCTELRLKLTEEVPYRYIINFQTLSHRFRNDAILNVRNLKFWSIQSMQSTLQNFLPSTARSKNTFLESFCRSVFTGGNFEGWPLSLKDPK